jgi:hypothetical protein
LSLHLKANSLFLCADITAYIGCNPIIRRHPFLLDCGATLCFCDEVFAKGINLPIHALPQILHLLLIDGEQTSSGCVTHYTDIELTLKNGLKFTQRFLLTRINSTHPFVLGYDWFKRLNPMIDWRKPSITFPEQEEHLRGVKLYHSHQDKPAIETRFAGIEEIDDEYVVSHNKWRLESDYDPVRIPIIEELNIKGEEEVKVTKRHKRPKMDFTPMERRSNLKKRHKHIKQPLFRESTHRTSKSRFDTDGIQEDEDEEEKICLIGAAPFARYVNNGATAYQVHIRPINESKTGSSEAIRNASTSNKPKEDKTDQGDSEEELFKKTVPECYHDFVDVFSEEEAKTLPPHRDYDLKIETEDNKDPPLGKIYPMSTTELEALKNYIDEMMGKGFICNSSSPSGAPVLFVKKKNGSLRLCVDYRGLNKVTIKNRYPLPLSGDLMDQLSEAKIFSKIDLRAGYHNVRIADGHEWKTAFRTRYGSYEYLVMPFGLTNAPSAFQFFMNDIFHDLLDICVIVYLDDILIYSADEESHKKQVRIVLERLRKHELHARPDKSFFHKDSVEYLGVIVSPKGISMDPAKVETILQWPEPQTVKEVQAFLGFANFYHRFIDNYSGITKPLNTLTRKDQPYLWTEKCQDVFDLLKRAFTEAPVLAHFNPESPIVLECDASDYAMAGIISQQDSLGEIHPIAFFSRSMQPAELNYDIYDKELLAIVECFRVWRPYLEGSRYTIQVYTDHNNLQYFTTTKQLSRRQARWSEKLSSFDYIINYRPGRLGGKPDALTRRSDVYPKKQFQLDANAINNRILIAPEQLRAAIELNEEVILSNIRTSKKDAEWDAYAKKSNAGLEGFTQDGDFILRKGKIYVPNQRSLHLLILQSRHDHKLRGHPGIRKTKEMIMRHYFWPGLAKDVKNYVQACEPCNRAKSHRHKPFGLLKTLSIPHRPWSCISIDHITDLPECEGFDCILVVACRLTKQAVFIPTRKDNDAKDLMRQFIVNVFSKHGLPLDITSDHGVVFVSSFWQELCRALGIKSNLSTAFHPQTDGQTERINQSLEQYLRLYINYLQDDWVNHLPIAEFAYNDTHHDSINMSPFFANKGFHPNLSIDLSRISHLEAQKATSSFKELHNCC